MNNAELLIKAWAVLASLTNIIFAEAMKYRDYKGVKERKEFSHKDVLKKYPYPKPPK